MGYVRAEEILPAEIIELIQRYVDGANIYVPRKAGKRTGWGEGNQTKEKLLSRNRDIYRGYQEGQSVPELAKAYFLSEKSIQRILRDMKKEA